MKKTIGKVNLDLKIIKYLCKRKATASLKPQSKYSIPNMNEIFKRVIQFRNLGQNIQRKMNKIPNRKEEDRMIFDCSVHCL